MRFSILISACGVVSWVAQVLALPHVRNNAQEIQMADDVAGAASIYVRPFIDSGKTLKAQKKTKRKLITQRDYDTSQTLVVRPFLNVNGVVIPGNEAETPTPTSPQLTATPTLTPIPQVSTVVSLSTPPVVTSLLSAATTQTTIPQISTAVSLSTPPVVPDVTSLLSATITQTTISQISTTVSPTSIFAVVPDATSQFTVAITQTLVPQIFTVDSSPTLPVVPDVTIQFTVAIPQTPVPQNSTAESSPTLPVVPDITSQFLVAITQTPVPQNSTTVPQNSTTIPSSTLPVVSNITSQVMVVITQTPIPRNSTTVSSPTLPAMLDVTRQSLMAITQTPVPQNSTANPSTTLPAVLDVTSRQLTVTLTRTITTIVCDEESSPTLPAVAVVVTQSATPTPSSSAEFLRGVNLGGWLVLDKWMNADAFSGNSSAAIDEWSFSQLPGARDAIKAHWETFFTEADIQAIAATGINALRIPIGFWAYDNTNTSYIKGADAYLERAIGWARTAGLKVWIDCHGSPGSQNGFASSGHAGAVQWQAPANLERSILVLKTIAAKYGTLKYADVVAGLQLINAPLSRNDTELSVTKSWTKNAVHAVRSVATNPDLTIVMHDAFAGALAWADVAAALNDTHFAIDTHMYAPAMNLTQSQHLANVCSWRAGLAAANAVVPTFVGEWSAATDICVRPDSSKAPGTACVEPAAWDARMVEQVRRLVEAQLDTFEASASGYFMWSAKAPGGWGFLSGIKNGAIPNPVTSRKYPGQCGGL